MTVEDDGHHAKLLADGDGALEERRDGLGAGRRDDVEIVRLPAEQQVAHDPAD